MAANQTVITPHRLDKALLFLIFNRLHTTKKVFETIRKAKPPRLYVAADGPRESQEGEAEKVHAVRKYVMKNIDWDCEVNTLIREKNLGCKYAVSEAIDWFFENEQISIFAPRYINYLSYSDHDICHFCDRWIIYRQINFVFFKYISPHQAIILPRLPSMPRIYKTKGISILFFLFAM